MVNSFWELLSMEPMIVGVVKKISRRIEARTP